MPNLREFNKECEANLKRLVYQALDEGMTKEQVLVCIHRAMDARKEKTVSLPFGIDSRIFDREIALQKERTKNQDLLNQNSKSYDTERKD